MTNPTQTDKHDFKAAQEVCERWLKHIKQQKQNSITMQKASALARKGDRQGAMRLQSQVDNQPRVFDGANFEDVIPQIQTALRLASRLQSGDISDSSLEAVGAICVDGKNIKTLEQAKKAIAKARGV